MADTAWLYCFSNPAMPGYLKIGFSTDIPGRLKSMYSTNVPMPFKCEFAKCVDKYRQKEKMIHKILERYTDHNGIRSEFFRCSEKEVRDLFELMDGPWYDEYESMDSNTRLSPIPETNEASETGETGVTGETGETGETDEVPVKIFRKVRKDIRTP